MSMEVSSMKTLRKLTGLLSVAVVLSLLFIFTSCSLGGLGLKTFTVDRTSVRTTYNVGDEVDFSTIKAYAKYTDSSLDKTYGYDDLTIDYPADITAAPGTKTVEVSFIDPNLNVKQTAFLQITVREDPNTPKHHSYAVDSTGMKTTYFIGDTVDFSGIKLIEKFTNGGADVAITDLAELTFSSIDTSSAGKRIVTATYKGESAGTITVTVEPPSATSIVININGAKLDYLKGDTLNLSGITATVTYENGKTETVSGDKIEFVYNAAITETLGEKYVIAKVTTAYAGVSEKSFKIKVDGVDNYLIDTSAVKLEYLENEPVSFDGIKVYAKYYFGKEEEVLGDRITLDYHEDITAAAGNKTVTVRVDGTEIGSLTITVGDVPQATANTGGVKTSYRVGATVSLEGLTVTLSFEDGTESITVSLSDLTVITDLESLTKTAGKKTVQLKYDYEGIGVIAELVITVYGIKGYTLVAPKDWKNTYFIDDPVSFDGFKLYAVYEDGGADEEIDTSRITFPAGLTATEGEKTVSVLVDGTQVTTRYVVVVKKNTIDKISVGGSYDTLYKVGDTVNFSGITVTLTYASGYTTTVSSGLSFSECSTANAGKQTVIVSFTDPINNDKANASFEIEVILSKLDVTQFEKSEQITSFDSSKKSAGTANYGDQGFSGQFIKGDALYVIGDDNEFKMQPDFTVLNKDGELEFLTEFYSVVDIYIYQGNTEIKLEKRAENNTEYVYSNGENDIVTVNTYRGIYQFHTTLDKVKISVLPDSEHYTTDDVNAVTLTAKVIDAYNVYTATELAIINNAPSHKAEWDTFRLEKGLPTYDEICAIKGIALHENIHVSKSDVPSYMFNVTTKGIVYKNGTEEKVIPAGTYYLIDGETVYQRISNADFCIEGNFFTIDIKGFPLVPSPEVFDASLGLDYGADFSNAQLFKFGTQEGGGWSDKPEKTPTITVNNTAFIGNAARNNWTDNNGNLVSGGGLILFKISTHATLIVNNTIKNSFFIPYLPDWDGHLVLNDSKCYDSYQNAIFVWSNATCEVNNSYLVGTGGPVVIAQSVLEDGTTIYHSPVANFTNTVIDSHLTGEELWFQAINAQALAAQIKALGSGLKQYGLGDFCDGNGKMNIKGVLMPVGSDPAEVLGDAMIQGTLTFEGEGIKRWYEQTENFNLDWAAILTNENFQGGAFALSVQDAEGKTHTLMVAPSADMTSMSLFDMNGNQLNPYDQADYMAAIAPFVTADTVTLSVGGLSVIFEFYH